jgi:hypothetical protein
MPRPYTWMALPCPELACYCWIFGLAWPSRVIFSLDETDEIVSSWVRAAINFCSYYELLCQRTNVRSKEDVCSLNLSHFCVYDECMLRDEQAFEAQCEPLVCITYQKHRTIRRYSDVGRYSFIPTPLTTTYVRRQYNFVPTYG